MILSFDTIKDSHFSQYSSICFSAIDHNVSFPTRSLEQVMNDISEEVKEKGFKIVA